MRKADASAGNSVPAESYNYNYGKLPACCGMSVLALKR